jgi:hypothetical protein
MCMNCGCGEPDKRHQPTDITREDLQRAADGSGMSLERAASNVQDSIMTMTDQSRGQQATAGANSTAS